MSLQEYMAFMISRETENIQSISDIIQAFKALTQEGEKPYITSSEIYAVRSKIYLIISIMYCSACTFLYIIIEITPSCKMLLFIIIDYVMYDILYFMK